MSIFCLDVCKPHREGSGQKSPANPAPQGKLQTLHPGGSNDHWGCSPLGQWNSEQSSGVFTGCLGIYLLQSLPKAHRIKNNTTLINMHHFPCFPQELYKMERHNWTLSKYNRSEFISGFFFPSRLNLCNIRFQPAVSGFWV